MEYLISVQAAAERVRAAIGIDGRDAKDIQPLVKITSDVWSAIVARPPASQRGASVDEMFRIADECGVPRAFMLHGFPPSVGNDWASGQLSELAGELSAALERIAALEADVQQLKSLGASAESLGGLDADIQSTDPDSTGRDEPEEDSPG